MEMLQSDAKGAMEGKLFAKYVEKFVGRTCCCIRQRVDGIKPIDCKYVSLVITWCVHIFMYISQSTNNTYTHKHI